MDRVLYTPQNFKGLTIFGLKIDDADLQAKFKVNNLDPQIEYQVRWSILTGAGEIIAEGEAITTTGLANPGNGTVAWNDFVEYHVDFDSTYLLVAQLDLYGLNCASPPVFGLSQKLPFYAGFLVGGALIGLGQNFRNESRSAEKEYWEDWEAGDQSGSLDKAREDFDRFRTLTQAGLSIILIDAVWYFLRSRKHRQQRKPYDVFCSPERAVRPRLDLLPGSDPGIGLKLNF